jgi:hypothetical protein
MEMKKSTFLNTLLSHKNTGILVKMNGCGEMHFFISNGWKWKNA